MKHLFMLLLSVVSLLSFVMMIKNPELPAPPIVFVSAMFVLSMMLIAFHYVGYVKNKKNKVILPNLTDSNYSKIHDTICTNIVVLSIHDNTKAHIMLDLYYGQYDSVIERLNEVAKHCVQQDQSIVQSMIKDLKAWQFTIMENR